MNHGTRGVKEITEETRNRILSMEYEILKEYKKDGYWRLIVKNKDGYKCDSIVSNLVKGKFTLVSDLNPYSLENISLFLKLNKKDFELCRDNVYLNHSEKLKFYHSKCDEYFYSNWDTIRQNNNCPVCRGLQVGEKTSLAYKRPDLKKEWDSENLLKPNEVSLHCNKIVSWICYKCGHKWNARISDRTTKGNGCPACSGRVATIDNNLVIKFPELLNEWDYKSNGDPYDYTPYSEKKVNWVCSICGNMWITRIADRTRNKTGCPNCASSKGEKYIKKFLDSNNFDNISEKWFSDCRYENPLPFDFYLYNLNVCIEFNGLQHYEPVDFAGRGISWAKEEFKKNQKKDKIKLKYCKNNGIKLIIIPYWDFDNIENILKKEL